MTININSKPCQRHGIWFDPVMDGGCPLCLAQAGQWPGPPEDAPWTVIRTLTLSDPGRVRHQLEPLAGYELYLWQQLIRGRAFYRRPYTEVSEWWKSLSSNPLRQVTR